MHDLTTEEVDRAFQSDPKAAAMAFALLLVAESRLRQPAPRPPIVLRLLLPVRPAYASPATDC